jgi:hypothetical protein
MLKTLNNDNLIGTTGADPEFYPECYGDPNCQGYVPPPRWYAVVGFAPNSSNGGVFTVTEDGAHFIQITGNLLSANFDHFSFTSNPEALFTATSSAKNTTARTGEFTGTLTHIATDNYVQMNPSQKTGHTVATKGWVEVGPTALHSMKLAKKHGFVSLFVIQDDVTAG